LLGAPQAERGGFEGKQCSTAMCWLLVDGQMLAEQGFINGGKVHGVLPPLDAAACSAWFAREPDDRDQYLRQLNMVNGVTEFVLQGTHCELHFNVARLFSGTDGGLKARQIAERIEAFANQAELCEHCDGVRKTNPASFSSCQLLFCADCEDGRRVCERCARLGFLEWSTLKRGCAACVALGKQCRRLTVLGVIGDCDPNNVGAFGKVRQLTTRLLYTIFDPYHQVRSCFNSAAGNFLYRNGERFCFVVVVALRSCPEDKYNTGLRELCSESALLHKDKHSMDQVMQATRPQVAALVEEARRVLITLQPERYRPWKQPTAMTIKSLSALAITQSGNLYIATTSGIVRAVLTYPLTLSRILTRGASASSEIKDSVVRAKLGSVAYADIQNMAVLSETNEETVLLFSDSDRRLFTVHLRFKSRSAGAKLKHDSCYMSLVESKAPFSVGQNRLAVLGTHKVALASDHDLVLLKLTADKASNGRVKQFTASSTSTLRFDSQVSCLCSMGTNLAVADQAGCLHKVDLDGKEPAVTVLSAAVGPCRAAVALVAVR
jgi:hypothetical protein